MSTFARKFQSNKSIYVDNCISYYIDWQLLIDNGIAHQILHWKIFALQNDPFATVFALCHLWNLAILFNEFLKSGSFMVWSVKTDYMNQTFRSFCDRKKLPSFKNQFSTIKAVFVLVGVGDFTSNAM